MAVHQLSRTAARRIAISAQLLGAARPSDMFEVVRHLRREIDDLATWLELDLTLAG